MLAESIIRIGRPLVKGDLSIQERIRWLTDVDSENCKNFFRNVFIVELSETRDAFQYVQLGTLGNREGKDSFEVDSARNVSFPILYPNGGNPLNAQGIYPVSCYLMYDAHIKMMDDPQRFASEVLLPRIKKTVSCESLSIEQMEQLAVRVSEIIANHAAFIQPEEKQLGILHIVDHSLSVYQTMDERNQHHPTLLWITESQLYPNQHVYLEGERALKGIVEARFSEASDLGQDKDAISTFLNQLTEQVVSIYNKGWLWLSPTWEMPRSIYWEKNEWTKGIKVDRESYEAFLYGTQFLKQITVPVSSSTLKEMFAPVMSVEAKKHMKSTSFEPVFGVPLVLPLLNGDSRQLFHKYRGILENTEKSQSDLHLDLLAGIKRFIPRSSDEHRLTILYYSGDLSRGNMHIRAVIEDVIPSVAERVQNILRDLNSRGRRFTFEFFGLDGNHRMYRTESLPALLANAYGPGYVWSSLQATLHRKPLSIDRLQQATAKKLNELANKEDYWEMKQELAFYYCFLYFLKRYEKNILGMKEGVRELADWQQLIDHYHAGQVHLHELSDVESLGFVSGMLLKQFSNSYYRKTGKDFIKHRVMKFGSKLTPEMIWKNGALRCEELAEQWDMGLKGNFHSVLSQVLLGFLQASKFKSLVVYKDAFMTAFWAGYLSYQKINEEENSGEVVPVESE